MSNHKNISSIFQSSLSQPIKYQEMIFLFIIFSGIGYMFRRKCDTKHSQNKYSSSYFFSYPCLFPLDPFIFIPIFQTTQFNFKRVAYFQHLYIYFEKNIIPVIWKGILATMVQPLFALDIDATHFMGILVAATALAYRMHFPPLSDSSAALAYRRTTAAQVNCPQNHTLTDPFLFLNLFERCVPIFWVWLFIIFFFVISKIISYHNDSEMWQTFFVNIKTGWLKLIWPINNSTLSLCFSPRAHLFKIERDTVISITVPNGFASLRYFRNPQMHWYFFMWFCFGWRFNILKVRKAAACRGPF